MAKVNLSLLNDMDKGNIDEVIDSNKENMNYFIEISDSLIKSYTNDLDNLMLKINEEVIQNEASDSQLEEFSMELSNMLYFMGSKLEQVGIKDDLAKLATKEVFNNSYLNNSVNPGAKKLTVAELTANAENDSKYESVLNSIYTRTYKMFKFKIDAAYEMLSTIKKILSKRMQDNQLAFQRTNNNNVVVGTEEY